MNIFTKKNKAYYSNNNNMKNETRTLKLFENTYAIKWVRFLLALLFLLLSSIFITLPNLGLHWRASVVMKIERKEKENKCPIMPLGP